MRFKKDKSTGLPELPEGDYFQVYEAEGTYTGDTILRIGLARKGRERDWTMNVDGERDPQFITKGDIRRAAKRLLKHDLAEQEKEGFKSPFIGSYPPNNL